MKNFGCYIPTKIFFGHGQIEVLGEEIKKYGSRVLLVYGGGSIKRFGHQALVPKFSILDRATRLQCPLTRRQPGLQTS
jgi:alcohol dehydrogenase YqhD (iron-dependent ADH family)